MCATTVKTSRCHFCYVFPDYNFCQGRQHFFFNENISSLFYKGLSSLILKKDNLRIVSVFGGEVK